MSRTTEIRDALQSTASRFESKNPHQPVPNMSPIATKSGCLILTLCILAVPIDSWLTISGFRTSAPSLRLSLRGGNADDGILSAKDTDAAAVELGPDQAFYTGFPIDASVTDPAFVVGESKIFPGHKGLIASRRIEAGQLIWEERPIVRSTIGVKPIAVANSSEILELVTSFTSLDAETRSQVLALPGLDIFILSKNKTEGTQNEAASAEGEKEAQQTAVEATDEDIKEILAKHGCDVPAGMENDVIKFLKVWTRNRWSVEDSGASAGLFLNLSACNHNCDPSALKIERFNDSTCRMISLQTIEEGEEITVSYMGEPQLLEPLAHRRIYLKRWFDECQCVRCTHEFDTPRSFQCPKKCGFECYAYTDEERGISPCVKCNETYTPEETKELLDKEKGLTWAYLTRKAQAEGRVQMQLENETLTPGHIDGMLKFAVDEFSENNWLVGHLAKLGFKLYLSTAVAAGEKGLFDEAAKRLGIWLEHFDTLYRRPSFERLQNLQLMGDLMTMLGRHSEAYQVYGYSLQALEELCIPIDHPSVSAVKVKFIKCAEKLKMMEESGKLLEEEQQVIITQHASHTYSIRSITTFACRNL